jgi:colicin import membrane protein
MERQTDSMIDMDDDAVRCGYSRCRAPLPAPGPQGGRPRSFCRDTRWDGGHTCAQMAKAERDALGALGLDMPHTAFALDADRLREHVEAVRGPVAALAAALAGVTTRLAEVEAQAVSAVEVANRRAAEAETRRVAAQEGHERAEQVARRARESAEQAARERAEALERAGAAARQALDATEALGAARAHAEQAEQTTADAVRRATEAERDVRAAQLVAAQAGTALAGERERTQVLDADLAASRRAATLAEGERDRAVAECVELTQARAATAAELAEMKLARETATARLVERTAERDTAAAQVAEVTTQRDALTAQLAEVEADRAATAAQLAQMTAERDAITAQLAGAQSVARDAAGVEAVRTDGESAPASAPTARSEEEVRRLRAELAALRPTSAEIRALLDRARGQTP